MKIKSNMFWADISHQLRSPLTTLKMIPYMLSKQNPDLEKVTRIINTNTDILLRRIDLLTTLMHLNVQNVSSSYEFIDFFDEAKKSLKFAQYIEFPSKEILADKHLISKLLSLLNDEISIHTVNNTLDMKPNIVDEFSATSSDKFAELKIVLTISETIANKDLILESQERIEICRKIANIHNGKFEVNYKPGNIVFVIKLSTKPKPVKG